MERSRANCGSCSSGGGVGRHRAPHRITRAWMNRDVPASLLRRQKVLTDAGWPRAAQTSSACRSSSSPTTSSRRWSSCLSATSTGGVGQKSYNGVALLSGIPSNPRRSFTVGPNDARARLVQATIHPGSRALLLRAQRDELGSGPLRHKLTFFARLHRELCPQAGDAREALVLCGDLNITPDPTTTLVAGEMNGKLHAPGRRARRVRPQRSPGASPTRSGQKNPAVRDFTPLGLPPRRVQGTRGCASTTTPSPRRRSPGGRWATPRLLGSTTEVGPTSRSCSGCPIDAKSHPNVPPRTQSPGECPFGGRRPRPYPRSRAFVRRTQTHAPPGPPSPAAGVARGQSRDFIVGRRGNRGAFASGVRP